ncbi:uncharacterized protein LOC134527205 [Bacillus rossius redtenbacheri]|uniref:uncharacterized protein LOC134527205 n=1 Tax=Bacillus rossius redtenbacheri TaxID=93214 RepID=UPI002FDCEB9F
MYGAGKRKRKSIACISKRHFNRLIYNATENETEHAVYVHHNDISTLPQENDSGNCISHKILNSRIAHSSDFLQTTSRATYNNDADSSVIHGTEQEQTSQSRITNNDDKFCDGRSTDVVFSSDSDNNVEEVVCRPCNLDSVPVDLNLRKHVALWAPEYNIPQNAVSSLLKIIKPHLPIHEIPKDARTLLNTPRSIFIHDMPPGKYCHFGLEKACREIICDLKKYNIDNTYLQLLVNIDGLPLSKSSSSCIWPILCSSPALNKVCVVGVYHGYEKPRSANDFLQTFVTEASHLVHYGIIVENETTAVKIHALICDAPAKAFVLYIKGHSGYNSCVKCTVQGQYKERRVCFPGINFNKRCDEDFVSNTDEDFHMGATILTQIPHFGPVSSVPFDYMHLVCLGVMKKMLILWMKGSLSVRLSSKMVSEVSKALLEIKGCIPNDFSRSPRSLAEINNWKATEFRQFLLYTGPVVMKEYLTKDVYTHFLTLHVAVSLLVSPRVSECSVQYASKLLKHFVQSFGILYGNENISHNVHGLLHLSEDVLKYGPLDLFSAFRFESYMQTLKKLIRKNEKPLEQLSRRYIEQNISLSSSPVEKICEFYHPHTDGPVPPDLQPKEQYRCYKNNLFSIDIISSEKNNCCFLYNGTTVSVQNIIYCQRDGYFIVGYENLSQRSLYVKPCDSNLLGINIVNKMHVLKSWPVDMICCKMWNIY